MEHSKDALVNQDAILQVRVLTVEEQWKPLDAARDVLLSMEEKHNLPLVSRHVNQLAAAYVRLGLRSELSALINDHLQDRVPPLLPLRGRDCRPSPENPNGGRRRTTVTVKRPS